MRGGVFIDGDVSVVLCDGARWAPQTWIEAPVFYSGLHSSLRFYAQSTGENMGRVVSTGYGFCSVDTLEINGGYLMYDYTATETVSVYTVNFIMNGGKVVISNAYKGVSGETLCLNGGELDVSSSSLGIGVGKNLVFGKSYCDFVCNCTSFGYYGDDDIQIADYVRVKLGDKEYLSSIPYDITDVENITKMSTHYDEGLVAIESVSKKLEESDMWYTLTGVRLATEPIERGVYIHNNRKVIVKESYTEALNSTNNIGNKMSNINSNKERNTIIPINIKQSEENIQTIIKKYPNTRENKMNCKSPEIKSIFNNIKINININSNTVDKIRNKNLARLQSINSNKKYGYNLEIPKKEIEQKLYILTDANKEGNKDIFKSIAISPNKNYINNSERSNKRKGISLPHNNKNSKYNLTKIIQKVKNKNIKDEQNDIIKKNKSYVDNHSSIENPGMEEIKKKVGGIKIISNKNSNSKAKKKEDLLRYILFNSKNSGQNNYKIDAISINNQFLPKLNDHIYSH